MLSSLLSELQKMVTPTHPPQPPPPKNIRDHNKPIKTTYESLPICLPPNFLATEPGVTPPPTLTEIDWSKTDVPENNGLYAVVLDGVLTREECETLKRLAEGSVPLGKWVECPEEEAVQPSAEQLATGTVAKTDDEEGSGEVQGDIKHGETTGETAPASAPSPGEGEGGGGGPRTPWTPALVNVGMGYEVLSPSYRNSSRIIWDQQEIVDRLWERCCLAPGLRERLSLLDANTERDARIITGVALRKPFHLDGNGNGDKKELERYANGKKKGKRTVARERLRRDGRTGKWEFVNVNQRLRFLRYSPGQFFRPHCDSPYRALDPINPDRVNETLFTIHLYLNDCKSEAPPELKEQTELEGGATAMLSGDEKRKYDVDCKVGRVLIFQHRRVLHAGADVLKGVKYSVRTDVMYREVLEEEEEGRKVEEEQGERQVEGDGKTGKTGGEE